MKKEDIDKTKEGELEEVTGFHYVKGSICRLSPDDDDPPIVISEESIEKGMVSCPRCAGKMEVRPDGKFWCPQDGLVLTDELMKKFGINQK